MSFFSFLFFFFLSFSSFFSVTCPSLPSSSIHVSNHNLITFLPYFAFIFSCAAFYFQDDVLVAEGFNKHTSLPHTVISPFMSSVIQYLLLVCGSFHSRCQGTERLRLMSHHHSFSLPVKLFIKYARRERYFPVSLVFASLGNKVLSSVARIPVLCGHE